MKQISILIFILICVKFNSINAFGIKDISDGASQLMHRLESGLESQMQSDEGKADTVCEQNCAKQVAEFRKNITELYVAFLALHAEMAHINQHINHHERALKHIAHWAHKKDSKDNNHHHHEHALKNGTVHQHIHDHKHNRNDTDDGEMHSEDHSDADHHSRNATDEQHHHHSGHEDHHSRNATEEHDDHHSDNHQQNNHEEEQHHHDHQHGSHNQHHHKSQEEHNEDKHQHNDHEEHHKHNHDNHEERNDEHHHEEHHHHSHKHDNDEQDSDQKKKFNFTRDIDEQNDDRNQQNSFDASKIFKSINLDPQTVSSILSPYFSEDAQKKVQISEKDLQLWFRKIIDNIHKTAHTGNNDTHSHDSDSEDEHHNHHNHHNHHERHNEGHDDHHDRHHDDHNDHNDQHHHHNDGHHSHDHVDDNEENRKNIDAMEKSMNDDDDYTFATCLVRPNRHIALLNQQDVSGRINLWQKKNNRSALYVHIKLKGFEVRSHEQRSANRETRETIITPLEMDVSMDDTTRQVQRHTSMHLHGFHVHEFGNLSRDCQSTGGHYNPLNLDHGGPMDTTRHIGDLGNIRCDENGETDAELSFPGLSLTDQYSIIGRSIVIHQLPDDYGRNPLSATSITTGSSGVRIACCAIEQVKQLPKEADTHSIVAPIANPSSNSRSRRETLRRLDRTQTRELNEILQQFAKYQNGVHYRSRFEVRTARKHPKYSRE